MLTWILKGVQKKVKSFWLKIFLVCHRCQWHRKCTLSCEYLQEISKKFEKSLMVYLGLGEVIHEKIWIKKSRDTVPLKTRLREEALPPPHPAVSRSNIKWRPLPWFPSFNLIRGPKKKNPELFILLRYGLTNVLLIVGAVKQARVLLLVWLAATLLSLIWEFVLLAILFAFDTTIGI